MEITLFSLSLILFLIMDPLGNITSYRSLVKEIPKSKQNWIVIREMFIALGAILLFYAIGDWLFQVLNFCETSLRLASGLILFLAALKIIFPSIDSPRAHLPPGEPLIFPLAIPLIAGPALLATVMLYTHIDRDPVELLSAILIAWVACSLVLFFSSHIEKFLGKNGLIAVERLMGMVLVLLAIQRFMEGLMLFVTGQCFP